MYKEKLHVNYMLGVKGLTTNAIKFKFGTEIWPEIVLQCDSKSTRK